MTWYPEVPMGFVGRPLGGNQFAVDFGNKTVYGKLDLANGLLRLRPAYTNNEVLFRIPTQVALESALQKALGDKFKSKP